MVPQEPMKRLLADGTYEDLPGTKKGLRRKQADVVVGDARRTKQRDSSSSFADMIDKKDKNKDVISKKTNAPIMLQDVAKNKSLMGAFLAQIPLDDLIELSGGKPDTNEYSNNGAIGNLPEFGIPSVHTNDGPAGARINTHTTYFPSETMLACTWNPDLQFTMGAGVADEMIKYGLVIWLAPGLNIHRNSLNGRNFEYYSEDPLVAGKAGANVIKGHQSKGCVATPKHFAGNEREWNRGTTDSRMSERAAREIYLKQFEIAVREGDAWSIMTSYNIISGQRPTQSYDLLTTILRKEWGFTGYVQTDTTACCVIWEEILAGNNLAMPWITRAGLDDALNDGRITRADIEDSVAEILDVIMRTYQFKEGIP